MKKYFFVISFLILINQVYAQQTVTINGKIKNGYFGDGSIRKEWYNFKNMRIKRKLLTLKYRKIVVLAFS